MMKTHFLPAVKLTIITMVLFGVIYPLVITGIAWLTAANSGNGKTVEVNGKVVGFDLIGQSFEADRYFNGRPSAVGYNASATGGSNKGPSNPGYLSLVKERIESILRQNPGLSKNEIPVDLITASGGGLDPQISPAAAEIQIERIASVRGMNEKVIRQLVREHTSQPLFGWFGPATVHVLRLNVALDSVK